MRTTPLPATRWTPLRPVPWPDTGDPHLDLLRAAVEARLYPYGDLASTPGRSTASHQISLLDTGRREGMSDAEVADFLSANLMCGGTPVHRGSPRGPVNAGYVVFSGRWGPPDVMGRRSFGWLLSVTTATDRSTVTWERTDLSAAFRRAFGVPNREADASADVPAWDQDQGVLF